MDPASAIIGIASGAAALVAITSQVVSYIINLRDDNRNIPVILLDLVLTCQVYESAWVRIRTWLVESCDLSADEGEPIIQELNNLLEGGKVMMELIHADLDRLTKAKYSPWWETLIGRSATQLLLHKHTVLEHRDRIHCQNTSLHLLLSCAKLSVTYLMVWNRIDTTQAFETTARSGSGDLASQISQGRGDCLDYRQ
jgi:hypothetical protein